MPGRGSVRRHALAAEVGFVYDHAAPIGDIVVARALSAVLDVVYRGHAAHAGINPEEGRSAIQAAARAVADLRLGRLDEETTANVGKITGGTARNVVPDPARSSPRRDRDEKKLLGLVQEMVDAFAFAAPSRTARSRPSSPACTRATGCRTGTRRFGSPSPGSSGRVSRRVRWKSGRRGRKRLQRARPAVRASWPTACAIHSPGMPSIGAVSDLDAMVEVTLALVEAPARRGEAARPRFRVRATGLTPGAGSTWAPRGTAAEPPLQVGAKPSRSWQRSRGTCALAAPTVLGGCRSRPHPEGRGRVRVEPCAPSTGPRRAGCSGLPAPGRPQSSRDGTGRRARVLTLRRGRVTAITERRRGLVRVEVDSRPCIGYPRLTGPVALGDDVLVNTQAVDLGLGSGGFDVLYANLTRGVGPRSGRRGSRDEAALHAAPDRDRPCRGSRRAAELAHRAARRLRHAPQSGRPDLRRHRTRASRRVCPAPRRRASRVPLGHAARSSVGQGLVETAIAVGACIEGDVACVTAAAALAFAAREAFDIAVCSIGPGIVGTGSSLGHGAVAVVEALGAAAYLGGTPILAPRVSLADGRERHRPLSHHVQAVLALCPPGVTVAWSPASTSPTWRRTSRRSTLRAGERPAQGYRSSQAGPWA